jgi:bifunctional non-homologous end joining protein LigD
MVKTLFIEKNLDHQLIDINNHQLDFMHLSKVYWPGENITKGDMLEYYYQIADFILPYLKGRPQSLNRFPDGIQGMSFYQKDVAGKAPDWISNFAYTTHEGLIRSYILGDGIETLLYMASLGCIEINPWFSSATSPDFPDYCVIDLDPDANNSFAQVIHVALIAKEILDELSIQGYCKTSGSTGIHIYIPLGAKYTYEQSKAFIKMVLDQVHVRLPEFTSMERSLKKREGKLYLDYLQNHASATVASPYSLRPKPGAPVSTPLDWKELRPGLSMYDFNIKTIFERLNRVGDLFSGVLGPGIDLEKAMVLGNRIF